MTSLSTTTSLAYLEPSPSDLSSICILLPLSSGDFDPGDFPRSGDAWQGDVEELPAPISSLPGLPRDPSAERIRRFLPVVDLGVAGDETFESLLLLRFLGLKYSSACNSLTVFSLGSSRPSPTACFALASLLLPRRCVFLHFISIGSSFSRPTCRM